MKNYYITIFEEKKLIQALTLYYSFRKYNNHSFFIFACLNERSVKLISLFKFKKTLIISTKNLDQKKIHTIKNNRPQKEFYWTLKSIFCNYAINKFNDLDFLIYVDADTFFFSSTENYLDINYMYDLILTPHDFSEKFKEKNANLDALGRFNAGCLFFKNSKNSKLILNWWMKKCIDDCSVNYQKGILGDQKYFDDIYEKMKNVFICQNKGLNLGPWNVDSFDITNDKCILYHFQGLKIINSMIFDLYPGFQLINDQQYNFFYKAYLKCIKKNIASFIKVHQHYNLSNLYLPTNILREIKKIILKRSNIKFLF